MTHEELFVESSHGQSGRSVICEDDGVSAWLYLTDKNSSRPVADVWVYNRIAAPDRSRLVEYKDGPPPAAQGFASPQALISSPETSVWKIKWTPAGEAVALLKDDVAVAFVLSSELAGYSKGLIQNGPWGKTWSDSLYESIFEEAV